MRNNLLGKRRGLASKRRKPNNWISSVCAGFTETDTEKTGTVKDTKAWNFRPEISGSSKTCKPATAIRTLYITDRPREVRH